MRAHLLLVHCNLLSKNITSLSSRRHASVAKISGEVKAGGAGIVACVRVGLQLSWKLNSNQPGKKLTKHIKYKVRSLQPIVANEYCLNIPAYPNYILSSSLMSHAPSGVSLTLIATRLR